MPSASMSSDLTQNPKLLKSFKLLKTHAASVASFTLQWQDLQDHFVSIHTSIESRIASLQNQSQPKPKPKPKSKSNIQHDEAADIKSLVLYLCQHSKELECMRDHVCDTLKGFSSDDLGGMIVKEITELFYPENVDLRFEIGVVRRSCVLVLEEFAKLRVSVGEEAKEEARKVAAWWKGRVQSGLEDLGFLRFLVAFGLVGDFDGKELFRMFENVMQRKDSPQLLRDLGFSDKVPGFIRNLITQEKRVEAIKFIYAFELVDKYPPDPLLKAHLKYARNVANMTCKKGDNSVEAKEAINKEVGALKAIVRCIETYKLGSQYPPENITRLIKQLRNQKKEKKHTATAPGSNVQQQQRSGDKRKAQQQQRSGDKHIAHGPKAQPNQHNGNKRPRPTSPSYVGDASHIRPIQPSHQAAGLFASQSAQHFTPPGESATLNAPLGSASTNHSMHPSHRQPAGLFMGQGAQHLNPSPFAGQYGLAGSPPVSLLGRSSAGPYSFLGSTPVNQYMSLAAETYGLAASNLHTQHMNSTVGSYGLASSVLDAQHMNSTAGSYGLVGPANVTARRSLSAGQYGMSNAAYGSTTQLGLVGSPATTGIAPRGSPDRYARSYQYDLPSLLTYDRPVSYFGVQPQRPPSMNHH